jgi:hypothetical protein
MKAFNIAEFAHQLAFNIPVVETVKCDSCRKETPVDDIFSDLCPECVEKRIAETDEIPCYTCGKWHYTDDMATEDQCNSCYYENLADLQCHNMMEA